jgi:signal transduction histidine kinase
VSSATASNSSRFCSTFLSTRSRRWPAAWTAGSVVLEVSDTGQGLGPEERDRIFQPFYTTKAEGMGMGLSISRSIIESHGGRLSVTDNGARPGVTFTVTLPAAMAKDTAA